MEATEKRFSEAEERKMRNMEPSRGDSTRRLEIAENLVEAAKETNGEQSGPVENEWIRTKEDEDSEVEARYYR